MARLKQFASFSLILFAALIFAALLAFAAWRTGSAASTEEDCVLDGGSWSPDPSSAYPDSFGTCTYPANSNWAISNCGADFDYSVTYHGDESVTTVCTAAAPVSPPGSGPGSGGGNIDPPVGCRSEVRGPLEQIVTLAVCHGKSGAATFPVGACTLKCSVTSGLPGPAVRSCPTALWPPSMCAPWMLGARRARTPTPCASL